MYCMQAVYPFESITVLKGPEDFRQLSSDIASTADKIELLVEQGWEISPGIGCLYVTKCCLHEEAVRELADMGVTHDEDCQCMAMDEATYDFSDMMDMNNSEDR